MFHEDYDVPPFSLEWENDPNLAPKKDKATGVKSMFLQPPTVVRQLASNNPAGTPAPPPTPAPSPGAYTTYQHLLHMQAQSGDLLDKLQAAEYVHTQDQRAIHHLAHAHADECERAWKAEAALADAERECAQLKTMLPHHEEAHKVFMDDFHRLEREYANYKSRSLRIEEERNKIKIENAQLVKTNATLSAQVIAASKRDDAAALAAEDYVTSLDELRKRVREQEQLIEFTNGEFQKLRVQWNARFMTRQPPSSDDSEEEDEYVKIVPEDSLPNPKTWLGRRIPLY